MPAESKRKTTLQRSPRARSDREESLQDEDPLSQLQRRPSTAPEMALLELSQSAPLASTAINDRPRHRRALSSERQRRHKRQRHEHQADAPESPSEPPESASEAAALASMEGEASLVNALNRTLPPEIPPPPAPPPIPVAWAPQMAWNVPLIPPPALFTGIPSFPGGHLPLSSPIFYRQHMFATQETTYLMPDGTHIHPSFGQMMLGFHVAAGLLFPTIPPEQLSSWLTLMCQNLQQTQPQPPPSALLHTDGRPFVDAPFPPPPSIYFHGFVFAMSAVDSDVDGFFQSPLFKETLKFIHKQLRCRTPLSISPTNAPPEELLASAAAVSLLISAETHCSLLIPERAARSNLQPLLEHICQSRRFSPMVAYPYAFTVMASMMPIENLLEMAQLGPSERLILGFYGQIPFYHQHDSLEPLGKTRSACVLDARLTLFSFSLNALSKDIKKICQLEVLLDDLIETPIAQGVLSHGGLRSSFHDNVCHCQHGQGRPADCPFSVHGMIYQRSVYFEWGKYVADATEQKEGEQREQEEKKEQGELGEREVREEEEKRTCSTASIGCTREQLRTFISLAWRYLLGTVDVSQPLNVAEKLQLLRSLRLMRLKCMYFNYRTLEKLFLGDLYIAPLFVLYSFVSQLWLQYVEFKKQPNYQPRGDTRLPAYTPPSSQ